jgi:hypothetical protein
MATTPHKLMMCSAEPNYNKSLLIGTIATMREFLRKLEFDEYFDGNQGPEYAAVPSGIGADLIPSYGELLHRRVRETACLAEVRRKFGLTEEVSSRMLNRVAERVGENMENTLVRLCGSLYDLSHMDINADTTSISVHSKQTDIFEFGYSRENVRTSGR